MHNILMSSVVAGYLPLVLGVVVGVLALVGKWVGAEWLDRRMYNTLLDSHGTQLVDWRAVREGVDGWQGEPVPARYRVVVRIVRPVVTMLPTLLLAVALVTSGCAAAGSTSAVEASGGSSFRSDRSYGCELDGETWVCSIHVETFTGGAHPRCVCSTRGETAWCTCVQQPIRRRLAVALPLEDLR